MCSLCGILGGKAHWTDTGATPEVFDGHGMTPRRERFDRAGVVNKVLAHYRLTLKDWQGAQYVLRSATGKTAIVENLSQMWAEAEAMTGRDLDPLDGGLLQALSATRCD
ncbi:MAG: hypothetical protein AAGJ28_12965 [Pseudomonadota bacterium]